MATFGQLLENVRRLFISASGHAGVINFRLNELKCWLRIPSMVPAQKVKGLNPCRYSFLAFQFKLYKHHLGRLEPPYPCTKMLHAWGLWKVGIDHSDHNATTSTATTSAQLSSFVDPEHTRSRTTFKLTISLGSISKIQNLNSGPGLFLFPVFLCIYLSEVYSFTGQL